MTHRGSCHCGVVAFEVEGDIKGVIMCNCSICHRKGATCTFNKHVIKHRKLDIKPFDGRGL